MKKLLLLVGGIFLSMASFAQEEDVTHYIQNAGFDEDLTWQADGSKKDIVDQSTTLSNRSLAGVAADGSLYALVNPSTPNNRADGRTLEATNGFIGVINGWTTDLPADKKCEWVYFGTVPYDLGSEAIPVADDGNTYLSVPAKPDPYNFEENKELPPEERTYTKDQMITFLNHWDNSLLLADAREDIINHFVEFTNILCGQHVFEALKIKAFACNGGNAAFPCDYAEAVKLLTILLKEFGFGYAANALGFIYYDGKLTGKPDFDKAFAYFAIASNYGIAEAKLKFADMLLLGDAGNPDPILAYNTYLQVYHDARIRFESGDYSSNLPESAIRIARALKLFPDQKVKRLKLLLEATYSAFVRYQNNKMYSDLEFSKEVQAEIDKAINEFTKDDPVKINSGWQQLGLDDVNDVFDDFAGPPFPAYYTVGVRKLKSNRYKLTIKRHSLFPDAYPPLSLSVQPWLLRAGLCDNLVFTVPPECGNDAMDYLARTGEEGTFDKLVVRSNEQKNASRFSFVRNGQVVLGFEAGKIFFNKPSGKTIG